MKYIFFIVGLFSTLSLSAQNYKSTIPDEVDLPKGIDVSDIDFSVITMYSNLEALKQVGINYVARESSESNLRHSYEEQNKSYKKVRADLNKVVHIFMPAKHKSMTKKLTDELGLRKLEVAKYYVNEISKNSYFVMNEINGANKALGLIDNWYLIRELSVKIINLKKEVTKIYNKEDKTFLLNAYERIKVMDNIIKRLRDINALLFRIKLQIKRIKRLGFWRGSQSLSKIRYEVNKDLYLFNRIKRDSKYLLK